MRFGGAMISLILPKLIRSLARDGIVFSRLAGYPPDRYLSVTTQGKCPAFAGNLPKSKFKFRSDWYSYAADCLAAAPPYQARPQAKAGRTGDSQGAVRQLTAPAYSNLLDRHFGAG